jgi:hypothetical protein
MPNSVVQGLTTSTPTSLNRLTAFQMVVLLGLLTRVTTKHPQREVRTTISKLLEIIEVSKQVALAVDREWQTANGESRKKRYKTHRYSPKHLRMIHEALLALHGKTVLVQQWDVQRRHKVADRFAHILDSFGYAYERGGRLLDLDDLPPGNQKVNVGTEDRPVWRVRQQTMNGDRFERPTGILFRLSTELADELCNKKGTIGFTVLAHQVFRIFKQFMRNPAALRLILLILRQTGDDFNRRLAQAVDDLGFDVTHPTRAVEQLGYVLATLQKLEIIKEFMIDVEGDQLRVQVNRQWYSQGGGLGMNGQQFF